MRALSTELPKGSVENRFLGMADHDDAFPSSSLAEELTAKLEDLGRVVDGFGLYKYSHSFGGMVIVRHASGQ